MVNGDGCSSDCTTIETGFRCVGQTVARPFEVRDFWSVQAKGLSRENPSSFKIILLSQPFLECDKSIIFDQDELEGDSAPKARSYSDDKPGVGAWDIEPVLLRQNPN